MIGIQPPPAAAGQGAEKYNFLEQLYANGTIEHKIIAFYINTNQILNGAVSIGAWDYNGIEGNNNCTDPNNDK